MALGYAPLAYHCRSGENTFAWYRGPLAPQRISTPPLGPFSSADSALIYDTNFDVFDASLASAWEVGRQAALSDTTFGPRLLDFRRKTYQIIDALLHRLKSDHFLLDRPTTSNSNAIIEQVDVTARVEDTFLSLLTPKRMQAIGAVGPQAGSSPLLPVTPPAPSDLISRTKALLQESATLTQLQQLLRDDIVPMGEWLARLLLLYPIPFDNLVPDERMLPAESLRFFYLDGSWLSAAIDGALSLGLDSSKHTHFGPFIKGLVLEAAQQAQTTTRDKLLGRASADTAAAPDVVSGFLLRSALVSGWPNLAVYPKDAQGNPVTILRIDHLAPSVLFCLFDGVPDKLVFSEPHESLRFGVNEDGEAALRHAAGTGGMTLKQTVVDRGTLGTGAQLFMVPDESNPSKQPFLEQVKFSRTCMRFSADGLNTRVLNLAPTDAQGLVQTLAKALPYNPSVSLGPSAFAIQMINAPEAVEFSCQ